MIYLKNTTDKQTFYIIRNTSGSEVWDLTSLDVEYTENGEYSILPPSGYDGLSSVKVTVNVDSGGLYDEGYNDGVSDQKAKLASTTFTENGTFNREDGWNSVTVDVDTQTPYDNGFADGEEAQKAKLSSLNVTANGTYSREDGYNTVTVSVQPNNQPKIINPSTSQQTINADSGYSGLGPVLVNAVTASIDPDIQPSNILEGVNILGVIGTDKGYDAGYTEGYDAGYLAAPCDSCCPAQPEMQQKDVTLNIAGGQFIYPDPQYVGMDSVTVSVIPDSLGTLGNPYSNMQELTDMMAQDIYPYQGSYVTLEITLNDTVTFNSGDEAWEITKASSDTNWPSDWFGIQSESGSFPAGFNIQTGDVLIIRTDDPAELQKYGYLISYNGATDPTKWVNTACPDWSIIDWNCVDVSSSGIDDDIAYTDSVENQTTWRNDTKLVYAPKVTYSGNDDGRFWGCSNLRYVPEIESHMWGVATQYMFYNCISLRTLPLFETGSCTNMSNMFSGCESLESVPLFDTSNVTDMTSMFSGCKVLTTVPSFDTSNVTSTAYMFRGCRSITQIPQLNTSNVTSMEFMFDECHSLRTIPQLDTSNVISMNNMFSHCPVLASIPLLNTSNVTNMELMFLGCRALTAIPQLDTSSVLWMKQMFSGCYNLQTVPLLDCTNVRSLDYMFDGCAALTTLGGFTNLGQGFRATESGDSHTLYLAGSPNLTYQSLMDVINSLGTVNTSAVTDATLLLTSTSYALLSASDIAIATNKGWSVVSA